MPGFNWNDPMSWATLLGQVPGGVGDLLNSDTPGYVPTTWQLPQMPQVPVLPNIPQGAAPTMGVLPMMFGAMPPGPSAPVPAAPPPVPVLSPAPSQGGGLFAGAGVTGSPYVNAWDHPGQSSAQAGAARAGAAQTAMGTPSPIMDAFGGALNWLTSGGPLGGREQPGGPWAHNAPATAHPSVTGWTFAPQPGMGPSTGGDAASRIFGPESRGDVNARNPHSSAAGLGQFTIGTWMDHDLRRHAGYANVSDEQWRNMRTGAGSEAPQRAMTNAYAERNTGLWQHAFGGSIPNQGQVYGMHFLDGQPFIHLVQTAASNPGANGAAMYPDQAHANPSIFYHDPDTRRHPRTAAELYSEITRRGGGGRGGAGTSDPFVAPTMQTLDPRALANMIPLPDRANYAPIQFPDTPRRSDAFANLPPPPQMEQTDVAALTSALREYAPHAPDLGRQQSLRFSEVLAGMAQGALGVDPVTRGVAGILLGAGAGASSANARNQRATYEEQRQFEESMRQFGLDVTRVGQQAEAGNRQTRFNNANVTWGDLHDRAQAAFDDTHDAFQTQVRQLEVNTGRQDAYTQSMERALGQRGQTMIGATEQNVQTANQSTMNQANLDMQRYTSDREQNRWDEEHFGGAAGLQRQAINLAAGVGVLPNTRDPVGVNVINGAAAVALQNAPGAINAMVQELALTQNAEHALTELVTLQDPAHPRDPTRRIPNPRAPHDALQLLAELQHARQPGQPPLTAAQLAVVADRIAPILTRILNADPVTAHQLAQNYAGSGLQMAALVARSMQPGTPRQGGR